MINRIRKMMEEREEGFTLIELLVVIIIIGILAAIAIPIFLNQRQKGYEASMKSDLRTVANEMETAYTDSGTYPTPTQAGNQVTVGSDTVTLSAGNTVAAQSGAGVAADTYCLKMTSTKTSAVWYYDSDKGGLQPKGTGCS